MYTYSLLDVNNSAFPSVLSPHQSHPTLHMSEKTHLITLHKKCLDLTLPHVAPTYWLFWEDRSISFLKNN